jgi:hypothetical protein
MYSCWLFVCNFYCFVLFIVVGCPLYFYCLVLCNVVGWPCVLLKVGGVYFCSLAVCIIVGWPPYSCWLVV